jgi:hypothetical protein
MGFLLILENLFTWTGDFIKKLLFFCYILCFWIINYNYLTLDVLYFAQWLYNNYSILLLVSEIKRLEDLLFYFTVFIFYKVLYYFDSV